MDNIEKIATLDNEIEARLLEGFLTEQSIPHVLRSYHDAAYDGVYQVSKGWGCVLAAPEHRDFILRYLGELRQDTRENAQPPVAE